ncbi:MAG TPA: type I DNA topoisomerase [Gemmatimonadaceae bacterium]|nr:type I DNA topoisomerase [Gemmatimonadaceae bacterium]
MAGKKTKAPKASKGSKGTKVAKTARKSTKAIVPAPAKVVARRSTRKTAVGKAPPVDDTPSVMGSGASLVIVESPAKAKTIGKYLGRAYRVKATVGHVRDLPQKKLGIDIASGFVPEYVTIAGKEKTLADLKTAAKDAREIFLATDPDREGEAIAWHVADQIRRRGGAPIRRVLFHEITKDAVQHAIDNAGVIDEKKVEAQQARRVLDRLVGYKASPLLWKTVKTGLSAGRVQTVALRLIVEREREIRAFTAVEYWSIVAQLEKEGQQFTARLHHVDGKKPEIPNEQTAKSIVDAVTAIAKREMARFAARSTQHAVGLFPVSDVKRRERRKNPAAPFTTSTLQQEAAKKLGYGSKRTMRVAQDLYEGIELGDETVGLITYMRTDSTRVSPTAAGQARDHLRVLFGKEFLADSPRLYGNAKQANTQDAHEAVRPTDPTRHPEHIRRYLDADQFKLYQLIWQRFMASQMAPAVFDTTTVEYHLESDGSQGAARSTQHAVRSFHFRSTGSVIKFAGYLALYREAHEEGEGRALEDEQPLPVLETGERIPVREIVPNQHFTEPPPRFSEASLVKELERLGIGRPSTYASIISTLTEKQYARLEQRRFFPSDLGEKVERVMVKQFPDIFNVKFTSEMEEELDKVEDGSLGWQRVLEEFWKPFESALKTADPQKMIADAHDLGDLVNERCPEDGGRLIARSGRFGPFIACENYPECKHTRRLAGDKKPDEPTNEVCRECGAPMLIKHGRYGRFMACSRYPECKHTRPIPLGVKCPKDGGDLTERRSRRGKIFFGCANYPNCDFVSWNRPVAERCPECGFEGAEAKSTKARGEFRKCLKCGNEWDVVAREEEAVAV